MEQITFPIRVLKLLGVQVIIGDCRSSLICDHQRSVD